MSPSSARRIRFRLLGTADLQGPEGADSRSVVARPKLLGVLSYLAAAAPRGFQRRDILTGLFWGELGPERARGALRQSLYYLRQFLGEGVIVTRGDEEVGLDGDLFWCDVAAFEGALSRGAREEALELYGGDLLRGFYVSGAPEFEHWLDGRRDELRERARVAAWELAQGAEGAVNATDAARWARQTLKLAPLDEALVRQVIELLANVGDRSGAVREYDAFTRRLAEELELEPAPETRALIEAVRSRADLLTGDAASVAAPSPSDSAARHESPPAPSASAAPEPEARLRAARSFRLGLVAGAALVVGLALTWAFSAERDGQRLDPTRIVVAAFENRTGDPALDPLGRMAADWVTEELGRIPVVSVVPSTAGLAARPDLAGSASSGPADIQALAEATNAGTVVAGAYYRSGQDIEIQAQVVDARTGELLSAVAPMGGAIDSPGAVVDSLSRRVAGTVARVFDARLADPSAGRKPPSLEAYRAYLAGRDAFYSQPLRIRQALTFFQRAVSLDSTFLEPRFFVVLSHINLAQYPAADSAARLLIAYRPRMTEEQGYLLDYLLATVRGDRRAALDATRALGGLDAGVEAFRSNRPWEAVSVLASVEITDFYYKWLTLVDAYHAAGDYRRELREVERGRSVYPDRLRVLDAEMRALAALGRVDEVMRRFDEIVLLPPEEGRLPGHVMKSVAAELRAHGHREAAFAAVDRALQWLQSRPEAAAASGFHRFDVAEALYMRERWDDARVLFEQLAEEPPNVDVQGFLGTLASRRGDRATALAISDGLTGMAAPGDFGRDVYWQACIASLLGERERAMTLLTEAYDRGRLFSVRLHRDMDFEPLHDYQPFQDFLRGDR